MTSLQEDTSGHRRTIQATLPPEQEVEEDAGRVAIKRQMSLFFHTVDKFVLLLRVYPTGHQLVEDFAETMLAQLKGFFEHEDALYVRVKARELLTEWDEPFFTSEQSEREHFLWYVPAIDGLVGFEIPKEITVKELVRFLSAVSKASMKELPVDDDTITLLWDYDLPSITIHAIENYIDSEESAFGELDGPEAVFTIMGAVMEPAGEQNETLQRIFEDSRTTLDADLFTQRQYDASVVQETPAVPPELLADAFRVDTSWSASLSKEWVSGDNLEYRLIEALLSIVRTDQTSQASHQALETIADILTNMLDAAEYAKAQELFDLVRKREELFSESEADNPLSMMMNSITDPMRVEALLFQAQKYEEDQGDLKDLFSYCKDDQIQRQVLTLFATKSREVLDLDLLFDVLWGATNKRNELQWLHDDYAEHSIYFERMLDALKDRPIEAHQIMQRLLARALGVEDREVRARALERADPSWCSSLMIERYIKPCMSDQDHEIRKLAIDAMRRVDPQSFEAWLEQAMDFDSLGFRPQSEILFLLRFFIEHKPERVANLRSMLDTKGWFNEKRRSLARSVALLLLEEGDMETFELLERQRKSFFLSPALKEDYSALLARFRGRFATQTVEPSDADTQSEPMTEGEAPDEQ